MKETKIFLFHLNKQNLKFNFKEKMGNQSTIFKSIMISTTIYKIINNHKTYKLIYPKNLLIILKFKNLIVQKKQDQFQDHQKPKIKN